MKNLFDNLYDNQTNQSGYKTLESKHIDNSLDTICSPINDKKKNVEIDQSKKNRMFFSLDKQLKFYGITVRLSVSFEYGFYSFDVMLAKKNWFI